MPSVHCSAHAITLDVHWFGLFFCMIFTARTFSVTQTALSLIVLMTYSSLSRTMSYFFFNIVPNLLSLSFPLNYYCNGSTPDLGRSVIYEIRLTVTGTFISNHRYPLWKHDNNCFTHALASTPLPKCGIWVMANISNRCKPISHWVGALVIGPPTSCAFFSYGCLVHYGYAGMS